LARKASARVVLMKNSFVSCYHSLQLVMPRKLNSQVFLISDLGKWFVDMILCILNSGA
jgi:hypothetical protein